MAKVRGQVNGSGDNLPDLRWRKKRPASALSEYVLKASNVDEEVLHVLSY